MHMAETDIRAASSALLAEASARSTCRRHVFWRGERAKTLGKGSVKIRRGQRGSWQKKRRGRTTSGPCHRPQGTSQGVRR
jgi:hypothetical protein